LQLKVQSRYRCHLFRRIDRRCRYWRRRRFGRYTTPEPIKASGRQQPVTQPSAEAIAQLDKRIAGLESKMDNHRKAILSVARSVEGYLGYLDRADIPGWPVRRPDIGNEAAQYLRDK
jgi:hypothetical protein